MITVKRTVVMSPAGISDHIVLVHIDITFIAIGKFIVIKVNACVAL